MRNPIILRDRGMIKVFKDKTPFNTKFYEEIKLLNLFSFYHYYNDFLREYTRIKDEFPFLKINIYPLNNCNRTISLTGYLIPKYIINQLLITTEDEASTHALKVFVVIPQSFRIDGVRVFDYNNIIDYMTIPDEYKHFRRTPNGNVVLCTHHKDKIKKVDPILSVLYSAWTLFMEYKKFERTGIFNLNCLSHTYQGTSSHF